MRVDGQAEAGPDLGREEREMSLRTDLPGSGEPRASLGGLDPVRLRAAFGAFPSGVVAVAARVDDRIVGLAASSFTSVSLDPPLVSFSIATASRTWPALRRADHVGVTVLADHHDLVARQLAGPADASVTAWFDTTIDRHVEAGDHTIVLLRLHAVAHAESSRPLVFHRSGFGLDR